MTPFLIRIGYYIVMVIIMFFTFVSSVFSARAHFYHAFLGLTELKREPYACPLNLLMYTISFIL